MKTLQQQAIQGNKFIITRYFEDRDGESSEYTTYEEALASYKQIPPIISIAITGFADNHPVLLKEWYRYKFRK